VIVFLLADVGTVNLGRKGQLLLRHLCQFPGTANLMSQNARKLGLGQLPVR